MGKLKEFFKGLKKGQKIFGENIAIIVNSLLLTVVYFLGVGLTSIIMKIGGKKFLDLKPEKKVDSYWSEMNLNTKSIKDYYRQF